MATSHKHSPLDSVKPVLVPYAQEIFYDKTSFEDYLCSLNIPRKTSDVKSSSAGSKFMDALNSAEPTLPENLTHTDKGALTHESTKSSLVDLFAELERTISSDRLSELLGASWDESPVDTLKIIWNARSIHLGKSERGVFYKCLGWLRVHHPFTLIANLEWAVLPVIEKKAKKEDVQDDASGEVGGETVIVKAEGDDVEQWLVKNGLSHGYYCDLVNILLLAVNDTLDVFEEPNNTLIAPRTQRQAKDRRKKYKKQDVERISETKEEAAQRAQAAKENAEKQREHGRELKKIAQEQRHKRENDAYERFVQKFENDPFYRALHMHIARLFATAIERDIKLLNSENENDLNLISFAAKWAPSAEKLHDRQTFIASSISELLFSPGKIRATEVSREIYLRIARENYRRTISALRKTLDVVEIKVTAKKFGDIKYNRVPSLAMDRYKTLFAKEDLERFDSYLDDVASGKANISGAVLLPSQLVQKVLTGSSIGNYGQPTMQNTSRKQVGHLIKAKIAQVEAKVIDQQWRTMVQRIRDSGTLENALAIADVSGSMSFPRFPDGTTPMSSSIGLSLLLAQVAKSPFNNSFITFSSDPQVVKINPEASFTQQVQDMSQAPWDMSTDFNAVFERLLLPVAVNNKIPKEDMVKRLFIFSDMQFDSANSSSENWETNYERIKRLYEEAGYDIPELVFWNLAGGRSDNAPKPVTVETEGTALVSGYSQAMLKVFLDNGNFEDPEDEEDLMEVEVEGEDGDVKVQKAKKTIDPMSTVRKAISNRSYSMLKVVD